jgi:hypothetical protein
MIQATVVGNQQCALCDNTILHDSVQKLHQCQLALSILIVFVIEFEALKPG